jgi:hypothetical protein
MDSSANEFRQRLQALEALIHMAPRRGLTPNERQALEELVETLHKLLDQDRNGSLSGR